MDSRHPGSPYTTAGRFGGPLFSADYTTGQRCYKEIGFDKNNYCLFATLKILELLWITYPHKPPNATQ